MRGNILLLILLLAVAVAGHSEICAAGDPIPDSAPGNRETPARSEADTYLDLNTGKSFKFIYDGLNDQYNRSDLLEVDLYVNTRTLDSFWLEQAVPVNNALLRDAKGIFKVDPMKVKRDGAGYKVVNNKAVEQKVVTTDGKVEKADTPKIGNVSSM